MTIVSEMRLLTKGHGKGSKSQQPPCFESDGAFPFNDEALFQTRSCGSA